MKLAFNLSQDENYRRIKGYLLDGTRALPDATGRYLIQKVPVVQWIGHYSPSWIINDLIAGLTVGVILVPQALAYAKIAGIPLQDGLLANINTGPTSIIGLLTAQIIKEVSSEGFTPTAIAVAISFSVGIYCFIMGMLNLGFLLEFVSLPVLTGFISAAAITIILGQVPAIFGETGVGTGTANQIHDIFTKLPLTKPVTLAVGLGSMVLLIMLQVLGQRLGNKNKAVWIISIGRNALIIILFTITSFFLNRNLKTPFFDLTGKIPSGLIPPKTPDLALVKKVFAPSVAVFLAASLEHIAIAKSFGRKNHYSISANQELTFLGVANLANSFFGGMAVGGAASRTAVNSESGVKSPLSGIVTSAAVLASIFFLTNALFWIPKATLSAVISVAVWQIVVSPSIAFWVTLFVSAEIGIESATAFMVAVSVLQTVFSKGTTVTSKNFKEVYPQLEGGYGRQHVQMGTQIVRFDYPIVFVNASRAKESILDAVQTWNLGASPFSDSTSGNPDRLWNELGTKRIKFLRQKAGIQPRDEEYLPQIRAVVLDFQGVRYVDATGIEALKAMKTELRTYAGEGVEI